MRTEANDRANTIEKIKAETHWLTPAQIADLPLLKWKREGRIFSVEIDDTQAYPSYQFDENFQPLPVIAEVLKAFKSESDSWKIVSANFSAHSAKPARSGTWHPLMEVDTYARELE